MLCSMAAQRSFRFGASDGRLYSQYWHVAAAKNRPELVFSGNRTGHFLHLTMHEDPAYWHIKITLPEGVKEPSWDPPAERQPGVRRLFRLLLPFHAIRYPKPRHASLVDWYPAPLDEATWVEFTALHCTSGVPTISGATLISGVTLADLSECVITTRHCPAEPGSVTLHAEDPDEMKAILKRPDVGAIIHGTHPEDGSLWFLELFSAPREC
jgi:hypothetical protein